MAHSKIHRKWSIKSNSGGVWIDLSLRTSCQKVVYSELANRLESFVAFMEGQNFALPLWIWKKIVFRSVYIKWFLRDGDQNGYRKFWHFLLSWTSSLSWVCASENAFCDCAKQDPIWHTIILSSTHALRLSPSSWKNHLALYYKW